MTAPAPHPLPSIVLVDDSEDDLFFWQRLMRQHGIANPFIAFTETEKAIAYLRDAPAAGTIPCAVLTDLKMPVVNGFEFVKWIRGQPHLEHVRVGVISSSDFERDRERAVAAGAQAYYTKFPDPRNFSKFLAAAMEANRGPRPSGENP